MRLFVTGGNGFIGSRVVRRLCARGDEVRCLLRPGCDTRRIDGLPLERVPGDLDDDRALAAGLAGCDGCVHLASVSSWSEITAPHVERVIVGGTRRLLDAAQAAGTGGLRFVYVSSAAAVGGSDEPHLFDEASPFPLAGSGLRYAVAKHDAEAAVLDAVARGLDAVVVNPGEVYGPQDHDWVTAGAIRDVLRGWPALALRGGASIAHVDDVAAGIVAALDAGRRGERYILGGDNLTVAEIVRLALRLAGRRKPVVVLPPALVRAGARALQALGLRPPITPELVGYASRFWYMDSTKARTELGYRPRPAAEVLGSVVTWVTGGAAGGDRAPAA